MVKNQRNSCCHMGCPPMIGDLHFHRGYSLRLQESKPLKNNGIISIMFDLFLRHASQQTEMILAHGLVVTTLAKLTYLAVRVEDERRWRHRRGHLLHIAQTLSCPPQLRRQAHLRGLAGLAMPDDPTVR